MEEGPFSGEAFREKILRPLFDHFGKFQIEINLDGTNGYPSSFLDEAFGGAAWIWGSDRVLNSIKFVSNEEPLLIEEIKGYIDAREREHLEYNSENASYKVDVWVRADAFSVIKKEAKQSGLHYKKLIESHLNSWADKPQTGGPLLGVLLESLCPVCNLKQFNCPAGTTCPNGHGF